MTFAKIEKTLKIISKISWNNLIIVGFLSDETLYRFTFQIEMMKHEFELIVVI